jgi:hypothetical protein
MALNIGVFTLMSDVDCVPVATHIANFIADGDHSVALKESITKENLFETAKANFEENGTFVVNSVRYYPNDYEGEITEDTIVTIFGEVGFLQEFDDSFTKLYLVCKGRLENKTIIDQFLVEMPQSVKNKIEVILLGASKEELSGFLTTYRSTNISEYHSNVCPYPLSLRVTSIYAELGLKRPVYHKDWVYEEVTYHYVPEPEKQSLFSRFRFGNKKKKKTKDTEQQIEDEDQDKKEEPIVSDIQVHEKKVVSDANEFAETWEMVDVPAPEIKETNKEEEVKEKDKDEDEKKLEPIKKSEKQEKDKTEDKKKVPKEKPPKEKVPKPEKPKKEKPEKPKKEKPEKPKKEKPKLEFFKKKADKEEDKEKDKTKIDPVPPPVPVPESVPVPDPIPVPPSVPVPQPVPVPEPVPKQVSIPEPKQEEPPKLEPIKPEPKQEEPLKLEPKVEESTTVVSEVKSNKPEPQKKPSLFGRRKEKEIPHLSRLNVFVSGIDHSVGTSYVAGSLASAITDIYDVDVWFDHKGMCSIPDNYMVHEVTDEVDRFNAFKSGIIVQDKGVYNELSIMDRNEMMHADMNIMVSTAEEMDLQKIAQFIGLQGKLIQNWMFVFNHVLDHQKHILESAMKDYAYIIIPFHDNAEVPEELLAEWKDAIDYFTK